MQLSKNFSLNELTKSDTALRHDMDNTPPPEAIECLRALCDNVLQPVRDHFGKSVRVNSGYRHPDVNAKVGGSKTSDHCKGMAAGIEIATVPNHELAQWIADNCPAYRQIILEFYTRGQPDSGWVHVSYNPADNKKQLLTATKVDGKTTYLNGLLA